MVAKALPERLDGLHEPMLCEQDNTRFASAYWVSIRQRMLSGSSVTIRLASDL